MLYIYFVGFNHRKKSIHLISDDLMNNGKKWVSTIHSPPEISILAIHEHDLTMKQYETYVVDQNSL
jgi:hypothetical protein